MPNRKLRDFDFDVERSNFCCGIAEIGEFAADTYEKQGYQGNELSLAALKEEAAKLTKADIGVLQRHMKYALSGYSYATASTVIQYSNKRKPKDQYWAGLMLGLSGWTKSGTLLNKKTGTLLQLWKYTP